LREKENMASRYVNPRKIGKVAALAIQMAILSTVLFNLSPSIQPNLTVSAQELPCTLVSIDYLGSPYILDTTMLPGVQFQVNISVNYVERLWAYQVTLGEPIVRELIPGWNSSVLHLIAIENGPFLGSWGGSVSFYPGEIDNTYGVLELTVGALDPKMRFPTGGGTLMSLTFKVVGMGSSPIRFGLDTALLNETGGFQLGPCWEMYRGTLNPDFLVNGYFENRPMGAELVRRSAWPEHSHYSISGDSDPDERHGTPGYQTLWGKVKNTQEAPVFVRVVFEITKEGGPTVTKETGPSDQPINPGEIVDLSFNFGPFTAEDIGKYSVTARAFHSPDGNLWIPGEKTKSFSFSIVA
jgi:hypothetical protein